MGLQRKSEPASQGHNGRGVITLHPKMHGLVVDWYLDEVHHPLQVPLMILKPTKDLSEDSAFMYRSVQKSSGRGGASG